MVTAADQVGRLFAHLLLKTVALVTFGLLEVVGM
jgi:hypothetical protein